MNIAVPKERTPTEYRVGLPPVGIQQLTQLGNDCFVETGAGLGSGFVDDEFEAAGARIVYSGEEAFGRADMVVKVNRPTAQENAWLRPGQTLIGFLHLGAAHRKELAVFQEKEITAVALEEIRLPDGTFPVQRPLSQIGGRMAAQLAARLLQNDAGAKGVLLGGIPGVPPAEVVIIGAGVVGKNAALTFLGLGAQVTLLDTDLFRLQRMEDWLPHLTRTVLSNPKTIGDACSMADVVVGAVRCPGERPPIVLPRHLLRRMRPGVVFIDLSIDEGGCAETSRPTTHSDPTYIEEGVLHCCIPNLPGAVARTATTASHNAAWPFIERMAKNGTESALEQDEAIRAGVVFRRGEPSNGGVRRFAVMEGNPS